MSYGSLILSYSLQIDDHRRSIAFYLVNKIGKAFPWNDVIQLFIRDSATLTRRLPFMAWQAMLVILSYIYNTKCAHSLQLKSEPDEYSHIFIKYVFSEGLRIITSFHSLGLRVKPFL